MTASQGFARGHERLGNVQRVAFQHEEAILSFENALRCAETKGDRASVAKYVQKVECERLAVKVLKDAARRKQEQRAARVKQQEDARKKRALAEEQRALAEEQRAQAEEHRAQAEEKKLKSTYRGWYEKTCLGYYHLDGDRSLRLRPSYDRVFSAWQHAVGSMAILLVPNDSREAHFCRKSEGNSTYVFQDACALWKKIPHRAEFFGAFVDFDILMQHAMEDARLSETWSPTQTKCLDMFFRCADDLNPLKRERSYQLLHQAFPSVESMDVDLLRIVLKYGYIEHKEWGARGYFTGPSRCQLQGNWHVTQDRKQKQKHSPRRTRLQLINRH